jgi:hypothetical protein
MYHRAPDFLTVLPDLAMLENNTSWLIFSAFSTIFDHRHLQRLGLIPPPLFMLPNKPFVFKQHYQLVFMSGPHPNLFRPITELARLSNLDARSFPPFFTSSILSLLVKLWDPLVGPISSSVGNPDSRTSPSPMRRRVLILVRV